MKNISRLIILIFTVFLGFTVVFTGHALSVPPPGLISGWDGDAVSGTTAIDINDGNNGAIIGGVTIVPGRVGNAFNFNGSNGRINMGNPSNLNFGTTGPFSLEAWFNWNGGGSSINDIIRKSNYPVSCSPSAAGYWLRIGRDSNVLEFFTGETLGCPGYPKGAISTSVTPNGWHHVVGTRDSSGTMSLFVDGVLKGTTLAPNANTTSGAPFLLGAWDDRFGVIEFFSGLIDMVCVYNRALNASEVQAFFNAGSRSKCEGVSVLPAPPIANAGPDQTVNEGTLVTLDGSGSSDPEGQPLAHQWTQIAGPSVTLSDPQVQTPTFTAPAVGTGGATLTFQLIVNDGSLSSNPDTVDIIVKNVNHPPVADAGVDQMVNESSLVALNGTGSYDIDGDTLTYNWTQTAGPSVTLSDPYSQTPTFTSPLVGMGGATLTFGLNVSDGIDISTDTVNVFVQNINHPPIANAGSDQTKNEGSLVTLDGSASSDPDSDPITYSWYQVSGPPVTLSNPNSPTPTFTAPPVGMGGDTIIFHLTVSDGLANSDPDEVVINVLNVNDPPACGLATANPNLLWPPNHKMVLVGIVGVSDPNNDNVTITITQVTQDEPVNGLGDGDTSPDAVIQGDKVMLRAERSGKGNGRVYRINFTADDGQGGICTGSVNVVVPHSMKPGLPVIDDGQIYDSTQP